MTHKERHALKERAWRRAHPDIIQKRNRAFYERNRERVKEQVRQSRRANPQREYAHGVVRNLLKFHKITRPDTCSRCGRSVRLIAHHDDYSKPREFAWICHRCHSVIHKGKYEEAAS